LMDWRQERIFSSSAFPSWLFFSGTKWNESFTRERAARLKGKRKKNLRNFKIFFMVIVCRRSFIGRKSFFENRVMEESFTIRKLCTGRGFQCKKTRLRVFLRNFLHLAITQRQIEGINLNHQVQRFLFSTFENNFRICLSFVVLM
jgi:hypothetical protein